MQGSIVARFRYGKVIILLLVLCRFMNRCAAVLTKSIMALKDVNMNLQTAKEKMIDAKNSWRQAVRPYQNPDTRRSIWQLLNSLIPYLLLWGLMVWSLKISYVLTLLLAILAAGFMVRLFIIFHDCGHGSFFNSRKANNMVGYLTGIITFTPYFHWRHHHSIPSPCA